MKDLDTLISFRPLKADDFPLLCKWLNEPHVHPFWGEGITWTKDLIQNKYASYVKGYKLVKGEKKRIYAFLILLENKPIGYIQFYNAFDFPREEYNLQEEIGTLSLAALDLYIGEKEALGKEIGPSAMKKFVKEFVFKEFAACLVDPDENNTSAIRAYEKADFTFVKAIDTKGSRILLMVNIKDKA